jgi:hypothetical protein
MEKEVHSVPYEAVYFPAWISPAGRIVRQIPVQVRIPRGKPQRISFRPPAQRRIQIPVAEVVQAGARVESAALE